MFLSKDRMIVQGGRSVCLTQAGRRLVEDG
jgi:hypothetical protein